MEWIPSDTPLNCSQTMGARSIASIQRLGLIQIPPDVYFVNKSYYDSFTHTPIYAEVKKWSMIQGFKFEMQKCIAKPTPLGKNFIDVCLD